MTKNHLLKRLVFVFMVSALLFAMVPAVSLAQEGGHSTETSAETHSAEAGEHAAEEGGLLTPLGINSGLLFVQTFNFLLMAVIMGAFLWKPAANMLDARSAKIQKGLEDAAAAAKARQNAEAEAEKILAEARSEKAKVIEEARAQGDEVAKTIQSEARAQADKIKADAKAEAAAARAGELSGVREDVIKIATAVASRVINEKLDPAKQKQLVSDFISSVPEGAKKLGGAIEVISAMPLESAEEDKVKKAIKADSYTFSVDPAILGGLIVKSSDRVVDGSVRKNLNELTGGLS